MAQHEADLKAMSEEVCSLLTECSGSPIKHLLKKQVATLPAS